MRQSIIFCCFLLLPTFACAAPPQVLFDQGHRQAFVIEKEGPLQLSRLAELFRHQGWRVGRGTGPLMEKSLEQNDAVVISGAFSPVNPEEIDALLSYLQKGGKLAVMIHIGQPFLPLLHKLGVDIGSRVINENQNQSGGKTTNFLVNRFKTHPLTRNLDSIAIYGGWPIRVFEQLGEPIASSSPHAWVDMNRDNQLSKEDIISSFSVVISGDYGRGSFVVFADDAIFQNQFLHAGNKTLAENLCRWLKNGSAKQVEI